jgi:RNA polymerase sigma factor (sigma-70 family)
VERECRRLFRLNRLNVPIEVADIQNMLILDESRDLRYDLSLSIQKLPEMYCRVLILRDIQELTAPETADLLNISVDAVKSRLHRARKMLREELMKNGAYIRGIK